MKHKKNCEGGIDRNMHMNPSQNVGHVTIHKRDITIVTWAVNAAIFFCVQSSTSTCCLRAPPSPWSPCSSWGLPPSARTSGPPWETTVKGCLPDAWTGMLLKRYPRYRKSFRNSQTLLYFTAFHPLTVLCHRRRILGRNLRWRWTGKWFQMQSNLSKLKFNKKLRNLLDGARICNLHSYSLYSWPCSEFTWKIFLPLSQKK